MSEFLVVGGGVAGLVAARRLALAGRTVTVLEGSERFGGIVAQHTLGGLLLDAGAESFATRGNTVADLATELGLSDEIVAPAALTAWLHRARGGPVPLPATSVLGIPGVPLAADVIAAVGFGTAFRAFLDVALPARLAATEPSIGGLVRRRMGAGMLEKLVTPVVRGVHSAHPDELSVERVAPYLRGALRSNGSLSHAVRVLRASAPAGTAIAGIRGGVHRLVVELLADLERLGVELRTGARVDSVDVGAVHVGSVRSAGETLRGTVIVAAAGVLEPNVRRNLTLATLVLEVPDLDSAPRGTGVLVADGAPGIRARALTHSTAKWPWLAERAGGRHVVRLSYDEAPSELEAVAREDAAALLGVKIPAASVVDFALAAWTRPAPESAPPPGITAIGEATAGSGLAAVIANANAASDELLAMSGSD